MKWENLPPRDHPVRERKPVERFANLAGTEFGVNQAFVAFAEDPNSPSDANHSPYAKQWEKSTMAEVDQLLSPGMVEYVEAPPAGHAPIGSCLVYHMKHDAEGKPVKFKV